MTIAVAFKALAVWALILAFAVANGALREGLLFKVLTRESAFVVSGLLLIGCIVLVALILIPWFGLLTLKQYVFLGVLWLLLTLVFEFGFGLARGRDLPSLLDAYRFKEGNIWPIVLAFVAVAPTMAALLRGLVSLRAGR